MINIIEAKWSMSFGSDFQIPLTLEYCEICKDYQLNRIYLFIINNLKEAGLLPSNYKKICCGCYIIREKMGGNYHKGCGWHLEMEPYGWWSNDIVCVKCGITVGRITEVGEVLASKIFEEIERESNEI